MSKNEPNAESVARRVKRKSKNVNANLARADANRDEVARLYLLGKQSTQTKTTFGRDGKPREQTVTKAVRPSKLLRAQKRQTARLQAGLAE
jgi:hypothetical protein